MHAHLIMLIDMIDGTLEKKLADTKDGDMIEIIANRYKNKNQRIKEQREENNRIIREILPAEHIEKYNMPGSKKEEEEWQRTLDIIELREKKKA